jgi:putative holliday junction resolvase
MKYLGIDFGTKRIGLALSDESGTLAFPHSIVATEDAVAKVIELAALEKVKEVVMGKSVDLSGVPNPLMKKIEAFTQALEAAGLTVSYESEVMTSAQAARNPAGEHREIASPAPHGKREALDASAAALILQSFLDRKRKE